MRQIEIFKSNRHDHLTQMVNEWLAKDEKILEMDFRYLDRDGTYLMIIHYEKA